MVASSSTNGSPHEIRPGKGGGASREASGGGGSPPVVTPLRQHCVLPPPLAGEDWVMLQGVGNSGAHAKALRQSMPPPEIVLWLALRERPGGFKFRRQHPSGSFVADFYCHVARDRKSTRLNSSH